MRIRVEWNRSHAVHLLGYILSASQTFSINLGRSAAETQPERTMQCPEAACAALSSIAFRITWSIQAIAPREQSSFQFGRFRGGIAVRVGPGCGEAKRELRAPSFPAFRKPSQPGGGEWPALDNCQAGSRGPQEDPTQRQLQIAEAGVWAPGASALLPHSFRGWRRTPFLAHKSLYAPVAAARATPAPQIINGGGRASLFFFRPPDFFSTLEHLNPAENPSKCDWRAILLQRKNWTHKNKVPLSLR